MASSRTGLTPHLRFRRAVLAAGQRAGTTHCPICQVQLDYQVSRKPESAEPDHIMPAATARALGWSDAQINTPSNGRVICRLCNQQRGARVDAPKDIKPIKPSDIW